jgi:Fe-S oxidoreductase
MMRELKKVVIIQAGKIMSDGISKKFLFTNITCATIAAAIPDGIEIEIIDMYVQNIDYEAVKADLVLVTVFTTYSHFAFEVARELRKRGLTVILGGVHAVVAPDECLQHFDAVAIGEAELLMDEIISDFKNESLKKRYETKEQMDLTKCKMPRYDLLQLDKYSYNGIVASKGCCFDCDFCSSRLITGAGFRHKAVDQIINEIKYLQELHEKNPLAPDTFYFIDSNLYSDRKFLIELLNAIIPLSVSPWGMWASVNIAYDDEVLDLLEKANCEILEIGFESVNLASLKGVNKNQNNPVKYKEVIERLAKRGIYAQGSFIFGFDDDDSNVFNDTVAAAKDANFSMTGFFVLTPFPGTRLFERFSKDGRILHRDWPKYDMKQVVYKPKSLNAGELKNGLEYANKELNDPKYILNSLEKFKKLRNKKIKLKANEKIALILGYIFLFFKLKPGTRYFIRKLIAKGDLISYAHIPYLISKVQNPF